MIDKASGHRVGREEVGGGREGGREEGKGGEAWGWITPSWLPSGGC